MAVRSKNVDSRNLKETFSSEMSGTQPYLRYGAIAIADAQPYRSANKAAMVRRSPVLDRSPMRTSSS
jgi:hypothetical protein